MSLSPQRLEELRQIAGGIPTGEKSGWMDELIDEIDSLKQKLAEAEQERGKLRSMLAGTGMFIEGIKLHGCMTGDCPHADLYECLVAISAALHEWRGEVLKPFIDEAHSLHARLVEAEAVIAALDKASQHTSTALDSAHAGKLVSSYLAAKEGER